jgi:ribosomal protein S18 acetylase RimI-like enzyme
MKENAGEVSLFVKPDYVFRRVQPVLQDAAAVMSVERQSLGDSPYTPEEALQVLRRTEHHAYLAFQGKQAVGFLSCLETPSGDVLRLELDMLGVCAEHRGRGIATSLLCMAMREAGGRGVRRFRGVVAEGNTASRTAFTRAGLEAIGGPALLLVYEILGREPVAYLPPGWSWLIDECEAQRPAGGGSVYHLLDERGQVVSKITCLQVQTLSYRGLWIEDLWAEPRATGNALRAMVEWTKSLNLDQVGYLATGEQAQGNLHAWLRQGYRDLGPYAVYRMG